MPVKVLMGIPPPPLLLLCLVPPQSADASSKQKSDAVARLEDKISQMSGTVKQLESR